MSGTKLLGPVRLDHRDHAVEAEVELRRTASWHGRAPSLVSVATINPCARQSEIVGRSVIMEQTLGGVKDVLLLEPEVLIQAPKHVFEIARIGLVGADVLGRVDRVELDA